MTLSLYLIIMIINISYCTALTGFSPAAAEPFFKAAVLAGALFLGVADVATGATS